MLQLPHELIQQLKPFPGFEEEAFIQSHSSENRITSIRINPSKKTELDFELNEPVKWCSNAYYLNERPSFTSDPLFHAGCYYVQEAGSMFIEHALKSTLDLSQPLKVLDLCAAPGGKSTLIDSLLNEQSLLIANEVVKSRAGILAHNLSKWGSTKSIVTNNDPQKFSKLTSFFDAIIIDAPCSGSGLFRKQPDAIDQWSIDNVKLCSARQRRILADVVDSLKENGILIYSTCSYSPEENEDNVSWLLKEYDLECLPLEIDKTWGIVESNFGYRFYPHRTESEGFFCAVLRKKHGSSDITNKKIRYSEPGSAEKGILNDFVETSGSYFYKNNAQFHLLNMPALQFISQFTKDFYYKKAGVAMGEIKGKDFVPDQELAWSNALKPGKNINLDRDECLKYLKKESFNVESSGRGFSLISYKNQGLGWAKLLPNRINNYLPNEFRILN